MTFCKFFSLFHFYIGNVNVNKSPISQGFLYFINTSVELHYKNNNITYSIYIYYHLN